LRYGWPYGDHTGRRKSDSDTIMRTISRRVDSRT
jgi:hypothetical protein